MKYDTLHWCAFNIFGRLFGILALLAALAFGATATLQLRGAHLPSSNLSYVGNFVVAAFCLAVGLAFLIAKPYRPDLVKRDAGEFGGRNSNLQWWTGAPKA